MIADVGQDSYEEVNFVAQSNGGRNFGWRVREGRHSITNPGPTFGTAFTDPFFEYSHSSGRSITGGYVYRGTTQPVLAGKYLVADYVNNTLWAVPITVAGGEATIVQLAVAGVASVSGSLNGTVSIDPDATGEPVITELNAGTVSRLVPPPTP